jgi:hypothetical protein
LQGSGELSIARLGSWQSVPQVTHAAAPARSWESLAQAVGVCSKFQNILLVVFKQRGAHDLSDIAAKSLDCDHFGSNEFAVERRRHLACPLAEIGSAIDDVLVVQPEMPSALVQLLYSVKGQAAATTAVSGRIESKTTTIAFAKVSRCAGVCTAIGRSAQAV